MNFIEECESDLSKSLGFEVELWFSITGSTKRVTLNNLCYDKKSSAKDPINFELKEKVATSKYKYCVSYFTLQQLPGCCGVCVSTNSAVMLAWKGKGVATRLNAFRRMAAHHLGYTTLLCTDVDSNVPQKKVLKKNNWKQVHQFTNSRTKNVVNISVCETVSPVSSEADCKSCGRKNNRGVPSCWWCQVPSPC